MFKTRLLPLFLVLASTLCAQGQPPGQRLTPEEYIGEWKEVAVKKMREHGIPASITLAQGLLESGNGNSELARKANNHFGIKCTPDWTGGRSYHDDDKKDDCFRKYKDAAQSYEDHAKFLQKPRYAALFELKPTDYVGWAKGLKKAGYATDPNYPSKLIALIERYELDKLDKGIDVAYKPRPTTSASTNKPATNKPSSRKPGRKSEGDVITWSAGRTVESFEGRIKYVTAKEGDDFRKLAQDLEMTHGMIARWNDMDKNAKLEAGQRIYIQPKRNAARNQSEHVAVAGETLWDVSQQYGVKLSKLARYNGLAPDASLSAGQRIALKKPRK
ncbi:MAG TPA: glucosaminidase domain-containing protein [Flavobacteriales bacterium]|nr:glucosaminidase domain-containing protein [Flavobacteriales bacterium]HNU55759.1 glucosaminidase domain-containing protein [Flavobacteriales bacterium]